ncbi:hypothetical protein ALO_01474 [Acetonema longum DSM 6540]|uniref:Uncharacterized protein n=1 Tax=Acetonema longum DSM 6540 TaxID=1009370 RepID=F7NE32_9FIRM|nr:hypothetical protein ALO_01474 [Acetonema longum DSM 6540]
MYFSIFVYFVYNQLMAHKKHSVELYFAMKRFYFFK